MIDIAQLYKQFNAPISAFNCGEHCAPHNKRGIPFCCDTQHAVPSAYEVEWEYLRANTDLWHEYNPEDKELLARLWSELSEGQVLIECLGHRLCQRNFRSLICRSFPFFPYLTRQSEFIGFSYYWEYEDRCWVISNLSVVNPTFIAQLINAFDVIFANMPDERENFHSFSTTMRRVFGRRKRAITLFHRNGACYKVTPHNGRLRRVAPEKLPAFGPYLVARGLPFSDEIS